MNTILRQDYVELASRLAPRLERLAGVHVLMTGAAGFIGGYICGFLNFLNAEVLARPITADLLDSFAVGRRWPAPREHVLRPRYGDVSKRVNLSGVPDYILHAAGVASPRHYSRMPVQTLEAGTTGTRRMLDLARDVRCRGMLFFSSSEVYGDPDPANVPTSETYNGNVSTSGPRACYDESKRLGETWSFLYAREHQVRVNVVRLFNVYGPGSAPGDGRVIPNFVESAIAGRPLVVHGRGEQTRTFCYIADAVDALLRVLLSDAVGEVYNIGSDGPEISIGELAAVIAALLPHPPAVVHREPEVSAYLHDNPVRRCPDITKLRARTGFRPAHALPSGLERTMRWYVEEREAAEAADRFAVEGV